VREVPLPKKPNPEADAENISILANALDVDGLAAIIRETLVGWRSRPATR